MRMLKELLRVISSHKQFRLPILMRIQTPRYYYRLSVLLSASLVIPVAYAELPIFDTHLHYSAHDIESIQPNDLIQILDRNHITQAVVTGTPHRYTSSLYLSAPSRIIPFLSVYQTPMDKEHWHQDSALPARVGQQLAHGNWLGIGELHIFADNRHSPVFSALIQLSKERNLILQMHCDPVVIDSLFTQNPNARVLWAHAGAYPYPPLLRDYLARYRGLFIDLSVREDIIAPNGKLDSEWEELFLDYSDRFTVGVDTYSPNRWLQFDATIRKIRSWLMQLPIDVAENLAYRNASRIFRTNEK